MVEGRIRVPWWGRGMRGEGVLDGQTGLRGAQRWRWGDVQGRVWLRSGEGR